MKQYIICSYPKSGNTWLKFIFANLLQPNYSHTFDSTTALIPSYNNDKEIELNKQFNFENNEYKFFKSHSFENIWDGKVIYIYRNPIDVLVSFFYHFKKFNEDKRDIETFIEQMNYGEDWNKHVSFWIKQPNAICLSYEDLLDNDEEVINDLLKKLDVSFNDDVMYGAVKKSRFSEMQKIEQETGLGIYNNSDISIPFVRECGDSSDEMPIHLREKILERNKDLLSIIY